MVGGTNSTSRGLSFRCRGVAAIRHYRESVESESAKPIHTLECIYPSLHIATAVSRCLLTAVENLTGNFRCLLRYFPPLRGDIQKISGSSSRLLDGSSLTLGCSAHQHHRARHQVIPGGVLACPSRTEPEDGRVDAVGGVVQQLPAGVRRQPVSVTASGRHQCAVSQAGHSRSIEHDSPGHRPGPGNCHNRFRRRPLCPPSSP